jgi:primosomal protein N'
MQQVYHSNATTNIHIHTELQKKSATNSELALRYNVSEQTISKWKNREFVQDLSSRPHRVNYALTELEKAIVLSLRQSTWMPLNQVWEAIAEINPTISRKCPTLLFCP